MNEFLEFDNETKSVKSINLDDLSIEDLKEYINELDQEIKRVKIEIEKKHKLQQKAQKFFE